MPIVYLSIWLRVIILKHELTTEFQYNLSQLTYFLRVTNMIRIFLQKNRVFPKNLCLRQAVETGSFRPSLLHNVVDFGLSLPCACWFSLTTDTMSSPRPPLHGLFFPHTFAGSHIHHYSNIKELLSSGLGYHLSAFIPGDLTRHTGLLC